MPDRSLLNSTRCLACPSSALFWMRRCDSESAFWPCCSGPLQSLGGCQLKAQRRATEEQRHSKGSYVTPEGEGLQTEEKEGEHAEADVFCGRSYPRRRGLPDPFPANLPVVVSGGVSCRILTEDEAFGSELPFRNLASEFVCKPENGGRRGRGRGRR